MTHVRISAIAFIAAVALALALPGTTAHGAVTYVVTKTADTNDGVCAADCSLREAVRAANANFGADTITLPAGTYTLTIAGTGEELAATADLDITDSLTLNGAGAASTIIDGNGATLGDRVIQITGAFSVTVSGVTVRNGNTAGEGGGIYNLGTLTLNNSTVSGNSASYASGGIANYGSATLTSSTVSGNTSANVGGGIGNAFGSATLTGSIISSNSANFGGGIYNNYGGSVELMTSTVSGNSAVHGGGIFNETTNAPGIATVTNSTVSSNTAVGDGGGMFNRGDSTLNNSTVSDNTVGNSGGGILSAAGALTVNNSTISSNHADSGLGGGIFNLGTLTLNSDILSSNSALVGGGLHNSNTATLNGITASSNSAGDTGGGISNSGILLLESSAVTSNSAVNTGGGISSSYELTLNGSSVSGNSAGSLGDGILNSGTLTLGYSVVSGNAGGGIYNTGPLTLNYSVVSGNADGGIHSTGTAILNNSTFSGNFGGLGGISNAGFGDLTLTNSTVSGNSGGTGGAGGIYNGNGTVTLQSSTVTGNNAPQGPRGIYNGGTVSIKNSIVASASSPTCGGPVAATSNGYNLGSDGTCLLIKPTDIVDPNPLLGPLAYNGGPTQTHELLLGSPALNNGDHACGAPATDQRGVSRPQGPRCDIGAFEAADSDGDATPDAFDDNDDNDGLLDNADPCPLVAEDYDGFQDNDGCPDSDNDLDGILDVADSGKYCFDAAATLPCYLAAPSDCRNVTEDIDAFKDTDGCPEPDNDNDGKLDAADVCPGTYAHAGADGMLGSPQDLNHNGVRDIATEAVFTLDDGVQVFEDYDGVLDADGCHDSPGNDFDGDGYSDDDEALKIGTNAGYPCGTNGWPSDLVSTGSSLNKVDIFDIVSFIAPVRLLDKSPGPGSPYSARWDLKPGANAPFAAHINIIDLTTLMNGAAGGPAYPPMLGGLRAFDKTCPLAP